MRFNSIRLEWTLIGTSVLVVATLWLFIYWTIVQDRETTRLSSVKIIDSLAISLEEHLGVTLRDARNSMHSAAVLIENTGGIGGFKNAESLHTELNREMHDNGSTVRLIVIDRQGRVVASSSEYPLPEINLENHKTFTWHADHPADRGFYLGLPSASAIDGKMVIPYSRSISDAAGRMAGLVIAELSVAYLAGLYAALTDKIDASVVVFNHDGILLMRVPYVEEFLGRTATSPAAFTAALKGNGNSEFKSAWDGKTRYYSHRVMLRPPVLIAVGVDKEAVMAPSTSRSQFRLAMTVAATLVFFGLVWMQVAGLRRFARSREALRDSGAQLQALSRRLVDLQEAERKDLARELHDRVGQSLTALNIDLNILKSSLTSESTKEWRERLNDAEALSEATAATIRNVLSELRPPMLDEHGLVLALDSYARQLSLRTGVAVVVHGGFPIKRPAPDKEIALFRIAQEALNNVTKHAKASRVDITLDQSPVENVMSVQDNGVGFAATNQDGTSSSGLGIVTIRERAQAVGGRIEIHTAFGQGTRLTVHIPLRYDDQHPHR